MILLEELYNKYKSDKGSSVDGAHNYYRVYEPIFEKYRHEEINLLEIGIFRANSFRAHVEYFTKAKIYGLDIFDRIKYNDPRYNDLKNNKNVTLIEGNSTNPSCLKKFSDIKFDIIIDDGSHHPMDQMQTFNIFWDLLNRGGTYFIEDIWPQHLLSDEDVEKDISKWKPLNRYLFLPEFREKLNFYKIFYDEMIDKDAIEWDLRQLSNRPNSFIFQIDHV